jgi:hypothetical protein
VAVSTGSEASTSGGQFGIDADGNGTLVAVGAPYESNTPDGGVYLFEKDSGGPDSWGEALLLVPSDSATHGFGYSVDLDGDTLVVGTWPSLGVREAFAYRLDQGSWSELLRFTPVEGVDPDSFGNRVGISVRTVAIGAESADDTVSSQGAVYIFELP